jgi:hypothetical protein
MLTERDLPSLLNILHEARAVWDAIATQLGLPQGEIEAIWRDEGDSGRCLRKSIVVWLRQVDPLPTKESLAAALVSPAVGRGDLAEKILPGYAGGPIPKGGRGWTCTCIIWENFLILLAVILGTFFYCHQCNRFQGRAFNLPVLKQELVGREREMKIIMDYLDEESVDVVTLFGLAGLGKSEIAKHVGHKMLEKGIDVYFIFVEDWDDVEHLERALMTISGLEYSDMAVEKWAAGLTRPTLLILDNVDGPVWAKAESRQKFQTSFLQPLINHSSCLRILITSQQSIGSENVHRFHLNSLSLPSCVELLNSSVSPNLNIAVADLETICYLVEKVPLAVKVLAAILIISPNVSVRHVIKRLNLRYFAENANQNRIGRGHLLRAIQVAFDYVNPKCKTSALLLSEMTGSFSLKTASSIITPAVMAGLNYTDFCLSELTSKSFLMQTTSTRTTLFHFHALIRDFLMYQNRADILRALWKVKFFKWSNQHFFPWLIMESDSLSTFDQDNPYLYSLAVNLSRSDAFESLYSLAVIKNVLLSRCDGIFSSLENPLKLVNAHLRTTSV